MDTPARLAAFTLGLGAVFGAALAVGSLAGPVGPAAADQPASTHDTHADAHADAHADGAAPHADADPGIPAGLLATQDGYALALDRRAVPAGPATDVTFRVLDAAGAPVTGYDGSHGEDLHLIAVRRDLSGFQHVHPGLAGDGTWSTELDLTAGSWRLFADFTPTGGAGLTLGADLAVAGDHEPRPLPAPATTAEVDGYTVTLDGDLAAGREGGLTLTVEHDGGPVTDLQPYLGAYGHLVVLRDGDLAYLHVHPAGEPGDGATPPGPDVTFRTTAPSPGTYRLFLDFRHGDVVRTAEFTVTVGAPPAGRVGPAGETTHADHAHGHGD